MKYAFFDQFEELTPGTVNAWAFNNIEKNSRVLEVGSSVGYLTKHLKEEKNCQVDIIEIDAEAGKIAAQFARKAYIGAQGDLDSDCLKNLALENKYDYIVVLDVLEHLRSPEKVVKDLSQLLTPEGKLILSVPNVAHNAVLINLFNNQFRYTELGLLDRTHITLFTYDSLIRMLQSAGFTALQFSARYKNVSETEIQTDYNQLPQDMRCYFRSRAYGNAYQFLLILHLRKDANEIGQTVPDYEENMELRASLYYSQFENENFDELRRTDEAVKFGNNNLLFPVTPGQRFFCFGPTGHNCILRDLQICVESLDGETSRIDNYTGNGISIGDGYVVFTGRDAAYLKFHTDQSVRTVSLSFELLSCEQEALEILDKAVHSLPQLHDELARVQSEKENLSREYQNILREKQQLEKYGRKILIARKIKKKVEKWVNNKT